MTFRATRARGADRRDPDHLPRSPRRPVEDEPADRRRGPRRRRPAPGRGAARPAPRRRAPGAVAGVPRRIRPRRPDRASLRTGPRPAVSRRRPTRHAGRARAAARRPGRPRRAAAPGAGARAADRRLPRRAARRRSTPSRSPGESFALLLQSDLDDPTTRFDAPRRRRPAAPAADPPPAIGGALTVDPFVLLRGERSARRGGRSRAARRARSITRSAAAIPLATGLPLVVTLLDLAPWELPRAYQRTVAGAVRPAPAGPAPARRRRGDRRERGGRAARRGGCSAFGASGSGSCRSRRARRSRSGRAAVRPSGSRPPDRAPARAERERLGLPERYLVYSGPLRRPPGPRDAAPRARRARRPPAGPRTSPRTSRGRRGCCSSARRRTIGRRWRGPPPEGDVGERSPTPRAARRAPRRARPRRPGGDPAGGLRRGRPAGPRGDRLRDAGRRVGGRAPCRRSSARPGSSSSRASRSGWPRPCATVWADERVHARLAAAARERAEGDRRTWADVAAETRRVYAEVGDPRDRRRRRLSSG